MDDSTRKEVSKRFGNALKIAKQIRSFEVVDNPNQEEISLSYNFETGSVVISTPDNGLVENMDAEKFNEFGNIIASFFVFVTALHGKNVIALAAVSEIEKILNMVSEEISTPSAETNSMNMLIGLADMTGALERIEW